MCPVNPSHVFQDFHTFSHAQSKKPNSSASASAEAASQAGGLSGPDLGESMGKVFVAAARCWHAEAIATVRTLLNQAKSVSQAGEVARKARIEGIGAKSMVYESGIKDAILPGSFLSTLRTFSVAQVVDLNLLFDSTDRVDISAALPPLVQAAVASHHEALDLVTFVLLPASPDLSLPLQVLIGKACLEKGLTMRQMTVSLKLACSRLAKVKALTLTVIGSVLDASLIRSRVRQ